MKTDCSCTDSEELLDNNFFNVQIPVFRYHRRRMGLFLAILYMTLGAQQENPIGLSSRMFALIFSNISNRQLVLMLIFVPCGRILIGKIR